MKKQDKTEDRKLICKSFELSCIGYPANSDNTCNIEDISYNNTVQITKDWYIASSDHIIIENYSLN